MTHLLNLRTIYFLFQLHYKHHHTLTFYWIVQKLSVRLTEVRSLYEIIKFHICTAVDESEESVADADLELREGGGGGTSLPTCGFIAQLVEHRTGFAEVTGSNPAEALIFQASYFHLLKLENLLR